MTDDAVTAAYQLALMHGGGFQGEAVITDQDGVERDRMFVVWVPHREEGATRWEAVPERAINLQPAWTVDLKTPFRSDGGRLQAYDGDRELT